MAFTNPIAINQLTKIFGQFYEQTAMGNVFAFGAGSTTLVSQNATATGLSSTAQPVIGVYNPPNSGKNVIMLQTCIIVSQVAANTVLPGAFVWVYATGQTITTGSTPVQRNLASSTVGVAKGVAISTALTGLSGNLTNSNIPVATSSVVTAQPATATSMYGSPWVEDNQGSWIVPPGAFLGVMNQVSTTTVSVSPSLMWAELAVQGM